jgi:hypothetical protein
VCEATANRELNVRRGKCQDGRTRSKLGDQNSRQPANNTAGIGLVKEGHTVEQSSWSVVLLNAKRGSDLGMRKLRRDRYDVGLHPTLLVWIFHVRCKSM